MISGSYTLILMSDKENLISDVAYYLFISMSFII